MILFLLELQRSRSWSYLHLVAVVDAGNTKDYYPPMTKKKHKVKQGGPDSPEANRLNKVKSYRLPGDTVDSIEWIKDKLKLPSHAQALIESVKELRTKLEQETQSKQVVVK